MATTSSPRRRLQRALCAAWLALALSPASAEQVQLEQMTSPELRERIAAGATTVLLPIGGTEQNGPHMVLGKHNVRARELAGLVAKAMGQTVVAPVMAYVPEGQIDPPQAHMRYAGTISISDAAFTAVLDGAIRSLRQHGFRTIVLLGDHGGYQRTMQQEAQRLDRAWAAQRPRVRVFAIDAYYRASGPPFEAQLVARGHSVAAIGQHAGLADTSLALAVDPALVRADRLASTDTTAPGVQGDPRRATAELGRVGVDLVVEHTVRAIRTAH